jgi:hypothetical protein
VFWISSILYTFRKVLREEGLTGEASSRKIDLDSEQT